MERCSVASFVEVSDTGGYDIIILGTAIWALLYIIGVRRTGETLEKKTSPNIWWIRKVVVPLHSQLKREGFPSKLGDPTGRKCLTWFLERCTTGSFEGFFPQ